MQKLKVMKTSLWILWLFTQLGVITTSTDKTKTGTENSGINLLQDVTREDGVERVLPRGLQFTQHYKGHILKQQTSDKILHDFTGELSIYISGSLFKNTTLPLLTITSKQYLVPYLEILLNISSNKLIVKYLGEISTQRIVINNILPTWKWRQLLISINISNIVVKVDCAEEVIQPLRQKLTKPDKESSILFGVSPNTHYTFQGMLYQALLYLSARTHHCLHTQNYDLQSDESSIVLGTPFDDRILLLEQQITQLNVMMDMMKSENSRLSSRVTSLETCECRPSCVYNGSIVPEGGVWSPDLCTFCQCLDGRPSCSRRLDIPRCATPCISSPCSNNGQCVDVDITGSPEYTCQCQSPYDGRDCQIRQNVCAWPLETGDCNELIPRFYYDKHSQHCLPFNFTGCGGNPNNFLSEEECSGKTLTGACCYRTYSIVVPEVQQGLQTMESHCETMNFVQCQSLHRQNTGNELESEVISFIPGMTCHEAGCLSDKGCLAHYDAGEDLRLGCQSCTCLNTGGVTCRCERLTVRKEIRDMTQEELIRFQNAVLQLKNNGEVSVWEDYRDLYMKHSMHSNGGQFYLPWHRLFLRRLEQKLQEVDCDVVLPYVDFSTDVGDFSQAILWQKEYFGGDGNGGCVTDHPFGGPNPWRPCIMRNFNTSIKLPSAVELALALASDDYTEMSLCLETYAAYIHNYIGGDMSTTSGPYDPVFYPIHAYIDMLYWMWQNRQDNKYKYPAAFGNIPMIPFNVLPSDVLDSDALCVTYALPSKGHPCNVTVASPTNKPGVQRGDQSPEVVDAQNKYNLFGYDVTAADISRFNKYGFQIDDGFLGYNIDGYDQDGYDRLGHNRYGRDIEGYDVFGFNIKGVDRNGNTDTSERYSDTDYDSNCLDKHGFTASGRDKYGFNIKGYDVDGCNFLYHGPFSTIHSYQILEALGNQGKGFLMTLHRTCPELEPIPNSWYEQYWVSSIKDVTNMVPTRLNPDQSLPSQKFCIETESILSPCACEAKSTTCSENPCLSDICPSYPEAVCHFSYCGDCTATWYYNDMKIDCHSLRDYCEPNPCEHGGTCIPSVWSSEPAKTTCLCPPGYDGHLCQYMAVDICSLPIDTGACSESESRWRYDYKRQKCVEFIYSGCQGNANNFLTLDACQNRCIMGACCFREPLFKKKVIGYNLQGFDRYGYSLTGINIVGDKVTIETGTQYGEDRFSQGGLDWQGYDDNGHDLEGYDRFGYSRQGYDREGFNVTGYSKHGEYDGIIDFNQLGFDMDGFNRAGFSCMGHNRLGLNVYKATAAYKYQCRPMTLDKCQSLETDGETEVVQYTLGKKCDSTKCGEMCGCSYDGKTYRIGESFVIGCQTCHCSVTGTVSCQCEMSVKRKEVRDMSEYEMQNYHQAIKKLQTLTDDGPSNKWFELTSLYASHKPQAVGTNSFLPWNRYFLRLVERHLQDIDCGLSIPYYDWTVDVGNPSKAIIWSVTMFGGNGMGNTGCVRYHPFKDYYPPYWSPCLRRQFNISVSLPDAVHVQLALNEPSYERFRIRMEVFAKLYQGFVGGHMASDYAPYDPLYFSLMAFIDKLWDEWQMKYDNGLLRYPRNLLFIPMVPFKSTPDDVMESRLQMCVEYVSISKGVDCNITEIRHYGFDEEGYDRHGYNQVGYDRDGYDVTGLTVGGKVDTRGVFNNMGYNRQGYGRDGYDSSGFDSDGFYVDTYNLDGYDAKGFDRSGYNRYGFDKKGISTTGYYQNGSINMDIVRSEIKIYDSYGYTKYGYDKYGYDRDGYDVYGFDVHGLDKMKCNYYNLGPMYMLVKHYVENKIKNLDNETLVDINRLCPTVTELEDWQINSNWLNRNNQPTIIETFNFNRNTDQQDIQDDLIRYPTPPDNRLCITSQMYSNCEIGQVPVLCEEDLCKGRSCPGHPSAVCRTSNCDSCYHEWYDGRTGNILNCTGCTTLDGIEKPEGQKWQTSICDNCVCEDGMVYCEEIICQPIYCQHPIYLTDQCCPTCNGCDYNGQIVPTNTRFSPAVDQCTVCECNGGNVTCQAIPCTPIDNCQTEILPAGECCPICLDCGPYADGDEWKPSPCQSCTCKQGKTVCEKIKCIQPACDHPYITENSCCPTCEGCLYQGILYENRQNFQQDECTTCRCFQGNIECQEPVCAPVNCRKPITLPGKCCPSCENDCDYEGKVYKHGINFMPSYNPCLTCSCVNSLVRCSPVQCPVNTLPCERPITQMGECCPSSCPVTNCQHEGREYKDGESWRPRSACEVCECHDGRVSCTVRETCSLECSHGVVQPGRCCSACSDCLLNGRVIGDGDQFTRGGGQDKACQQCKCTQGNIECTLTARCPTLPCSRPRTLPGHCCPSCPVCENQDRVYQHGDMVFKEQCLDCTCLDGQVICEKQQCPKLRCRQPVFPENECCPQCHGCEFYNQQYNKNQRFISPRDPCQSCICKNGEVNCESIQSSCPPTNCSHPEQRPNQCCRKCKGCEYLRRKFKHGQKFAPPDGDMCQDCSCQYGNVKCQKMPCPDVNCLEPVFLPGSCCPVCSSMCELNNIKYEHGEQFNSPREQCSVCTCRDRVITCAPRDCPNLMCGHPTTMPNDCCPSCEFCLFDRRIFRNMQRFIHPNDTCQQCICQEGTVTCHKTNCPVLPCRDTMPMAGSCCHVCPKSCNYRGLTYSDGQTFSSPGEQCKDCLCRQGQVQCKRTACIRVNCRHPADDNCCPICDNCFYQGLLWRNGKRFKDQRDPCIKCQCNNGDVDCKRKACPPIQCENPMMKDCCPVCSQCKLGKRMYRNGQSFTNPQDRCETCLCSGGNIKCKANMCPPAPCRHPVKDGCCMVCSDCKLEERTYRNGQSFPSRHNQCEECQCSEGTVSCKARHCPPVMCSNPAEGECCKECNHCNFNGQTVREGSRVRDPSDDCKECECRLGSIMCFQRQCSNTVCTHPVKRGCCQECINCLINGIEVLHGQDVPDGSNNCRTCRCENGNIKCQDVQCSVPSCPNPVQGECCLQCTDCLYNDRFYQNGQEFPDIADSCNSCNCRNGAVECRRAACPAVACSHPVQGRCCPECSANCLFQNREYRNGDEFERDCKACTCNNGNIRCFPKYCEPVTCSNPVTKDCCPVCEDCMFETRRISNGQSFPDVQDPCSECICKGGSFECSKRLCPAVNCDNPAMGQCCPECRNCDYNGQVLQHGHRFPDPSDKCTLCTCETGSIRCKQAACPDTSNCEYPASDECGCQSCDKCLYDDSVYNHLERFPHSTQKCMECTCTRGNVQCRGRSCSVSCTHPAGDFGCCPQCKDCLYEGKVHADEEIFISDVDPCQQAICRRGSILTQTIQCPEPTCLNPIKQPRECCSSCPVCNFLGEKYNDNTDFTHPAHSCQICHCQGGRVTCQDKDCGIITCTHPTSDLCCPSCDKCFYEDNVYANGATFRPDDCHTCSCVDGSVTCTKENCLDPPCVMSEKIPGQCCPVCKGCNYKGTSVDTGASWILPDNPCVLCTCHGGLVTCMEKECYVPCSSPIPVPGQCCPVCPSCVYNDVTYNDGDEFSPDGDPCNTCLCQGGNLHCARETCPNIATCPPKQLVSSQTGHCCPTCAGLGTNCTRSDVGRIIRPRSEDPCFYCECQNSFNLVCMKDVCPTLNCPPNVQIKLPGQCCSKCPACFDPKTVKYYNEGQSWTSEINPCESCECHDGLIQCSLLECPALQCGINEQLINLPGSCCSRCQPLQAVDCVYVGTTYKAGEQWTVDECTKCQCAGGIIQCNSQVCEPTQCKDNEVPSLKPGNCCPVCEQKPGTCLVFGDPHYRTFDGTTLHFQGQCKYIMSADCESDSFSVQVQHDNRNVFGDVSWAQNFTVEVAGLKIDLLQKHVVQVNGERVNLPYLYEPHVQVELSGNTVLLNTDIGLKIIWNGDSYAELSVPGIYKRKLCGLCGNFNGFPQDDLRTRQGQITNSPAVFGNSWKADTQYKDSCQDAKDIDPCLKAGYRVRKMATTKCAVLKSKVFSRCHRAVSPEPFFASCVYDMCVCMENSTCLCDILASYAHMCAKAGIKTEWRTNNLCAFECPANSGLVFDDCGPACPRTCKNMNTPLGNVSENCFKPCIASCQCAADKVLHEGKCINPSQCP